MSALRSEYDVLIVGAGPAGSSAVIRLAQNGLHVLLVEQKKFPRDKLCGEFISPECLAHFAALGVLDELSLAGGVSLQQTVFYARNGKSVAVPSEWFSAGASALGLSRAEMDARLLDRARAVGAHVLEETHATGLLRVSSPATSPAAREGAVLGASLRDKDRNNLDIRATLTIDATGRARTLVRHIEKTHKNNRRTRAEFVAFKAHLEGATIPDGDCEIYAYRGGYGGCSRVENGRSNLCFIVSAEIAKKHSGDAAEIMKTVVFENRRAERSLKNAQIAEEWLAVPIESYGRADLAPAEGLLTIGDAAAFIDPFTGSGILLALESAKIAAEVIYSEFAKPEDVRSFAAISTEYQRRYTTAFDRRLLVCSLLRRAAFVPFLAEAMIKTMSLSNRLTRRLAQATRPGG